MQLNITEVVMIRFNWWHIGIAFRLARKIMANIHIHIILLLTYLNVLMLLCIVVPATNVGKATTMFMFGDTLVDVGNNNFFTLLTNANYSPYGIDREDHAPKGHFYNGQVISNLMSEYTNHLV